MDQKCAVIGFSEALAREGARYNILVNAIAPTASTPALAVAVKGSSGAFLAEYCAPFVAALCSDSVPYPSTGGLFELAVGWHARTRLQASGGSTIPSSEELSMESALKMLREVASFERPSYPQESENGLREVFNQVPKMTTLQKIQDAKRRPSRESMYTYNDRDVMLYSK